MLNFGKKHRILLIVPLLAGCVLFKPTPTPLPLMRTATPHAVIPVATLTPLSTVFPTAQGPVAQQIILDAPQANATVGNPLVVRGGTTMMPFEATLVVRIYDARDTLVTEMPIMAQGDLDGPATFDASVPYSTASGAGRVVVVEVSPYDGSDLANAAVPVTLSPPAVNIESPTADARVTLPLHVLARVGEPGATVDVVLAWDDGTQLVQSVTLLAGRDGRGLLSTNLDRPDAASAPRSRTQPATLLVRDPTGRHLAQQSIVVLSPDDPDTLGVAVYWIRDGNVVPQQLRIPRASGIGRAALEALLWGPVPGNASGYTTTLPLPEEVIAHPAGAGWGERVQLNKLTIENGIARADFSRELLTNPGGAARMTLIRQQIEKTLLQFSTVNQVIITVEGQTGQLEP